ncbi:MAG: CPBP family intramembrane metalloprotease [Polyangiaceae bacterium]|nr:CPBP family intramembrane metalloprotease [Polyangiaceae bacterium]
MLVVILVALASSVAITAALLPTVAGTPMMWAIVGVAHAIPAAVAIRRMRLDETLAERLTPRGGDFTIGVLVAVALLVGSWIVRAELAPYGSAATGWLARVYLAVGDPNAIQRSVLLTATVLSVAGLVELTWRGLVQDLLEQQLGQRWGWLATAGLFTLGAVPTVVLLRDTVAGPNPLVVLGAAACGLCWGFLTRVMNRLWPTMFSHMVFLYFTAVQFHVPGLTPGSR